MNSLRRIILLLVLLALLFGLSEHNRARSAVQWPAAAADNPVLFFSDIVSGPKTGGQDSLGAFITLFGEGFGAQRDVSTVTIGGTEVAKYVIWGQDNGVARSLDMIVVQPGPNVTSGNIVVTVNGHSSNPLAFTVRSGQIYFVFPGAPNANDANPGTYAEPFKTLYRPRQVMQAGDIVYIKGGVFSEMDPVGPGWDTILILDEEHAVNGTADRPVAYIGYPGDRPVLANPAARRGILLFTSGQPRDYYVLANMAFTQSESPLSVTGIGHRVVGNYFYDGAFSDSGVVGVNGDTSQAKILGNFLRNNGQVDVKFHHGLYLGGYGINQDVELGWNQIQDQRGGRSIQLFGHVDGDRMDNIRIHDNLISGSLRNNVLLGGSDGGTEVLGTIYVYNNIIVGSDDQGLRINDPQGTVIIQNNVFYNNGSLGYDGNAQLYIERAGIGRITLQNNIVYAESGQTYYQFEPGTDSSALNASHNLVYNAGVCPAWDVGCVNADPLFADIASGDFRLQEGSPALDAGVNTGRDQDYLGISRPQGAAYDIGAHERPSAQVAPTATPAPARYVYLPLIVSHQSQPGTTATPTPTADHQSTATATPTPTPTYTPTPTTSSTPAVDNPLPPSSPVKLVFVHHSTGGNWLADPTGNELGGDLGRALMDNHYFVSATNYGWTVGVDAIGDRTDIGNWWEWFRGPNSAATMTALYAENGQNFGDYGAWPRLATNPGGENQIIVFKSCFPNSALQGDPGAAHPPIASNPLRGQDANSEYHTVANARGIYMDLLDYFSTRQDKLFVVITAPPLQDGTWATNARAFNNWLVNDWLSSYTYKNVAVFDFYNVLTSNGGDSDTNDLGGASGNHHRWWNGAVQHQQTVAGDTAAYPSGDDHPNRAGNTKATAEFVQLLNVFYNRWVGQE